MKNRILAALIITLVFFSLCVENKDKKTTTTTTILKNADKCVSFYCNGSVETRMENDNLEIAYCDGIERARIVCQSDEGSYTRTGESMNDYSLCCAKEGAGPSMPSCDRCSDGTACGSKNQQIKCSCEDVNRDGKYETCMIGPPGCDGCEDGTGCGQINGKKELCQCEGKPSPFADENEYMSCSLKQLCDKCSDGTPCGKYNGKSEICECDPSGASETCELKKPMTCEKSCQEMGYASGYCGNWIQNADNTVSECNSGEYPFYPGYHHGISLTDCIDNSAPEATKKTICCCKGEPVNSQNCPTIRRPGEPMGCIEEPGYLKDPRTGECCWYRATCYGPDNWPEYKTKAECLNPQA